MPESEEKKKNIEGLLRDAAIEKYGLGDVVKDVNKVKPLMEEVKSALEKINAGASVIQGKDGKSPELGVDYLTEEEQQRVLELVRPQKGRDYDDGKPGNDGYSPIRGLDYLTDEEMDGIKEEAKPVKGTDYFTPQEIKEFKQAITPIKGKDYNDGKNPTPEQFIEVIKGLKGKDAAAFSQTIGSKIDISHVRNAGSFIFNGKKYATEELMHGGGSGGSSGVQSVTGLNTNNADPLNPIVQISVDGVTITGAGTPGSPLVAVGSGSGTVTSVSVVTGNGFAGTVATATTTPAITIQTTLGAGNIPVSNGTGFQAAPLTGTGNIVLATSPTITGATLTTSSVNGVTLTTGGSATTFLNGAGGYTTPVGAGDVIGPASATDSALALFDTTTGKLLKNSAVQLTSTVLSPVVNDAISLGSSSLMWSDTFLATGGVLNWNNGNVTVTQGAGTLAFNGSAGVATTFTSATGGTVLTLSGVTSGVGIAAGNITAGTVLNATGITNGIVINYTASTNGTGLIFNTTSAALTGAAALKVSGSAAMTADYTGAFVLINPTRSMTAVGTRIHSGQMLNISPTYSITGTLASVYTLSGATATIGRTLTNSSSSGSSGLTATGSVLELSNTLGTATNAVIDTSNILTVTQNYTSASGSIVLINNLGTGNLIDIQQNSVSKFTITNAGHVLVEGVTSTGATGTGRFVFDNTPTLITPVLGVATATSINGNTFTTGTYTLTGTAGKTLTFTNSITLSGTDGTTMTFPTTTATIARTDAAQTFVGIQTIPQILCADNAIAASANAATVTRSNRNNVVTNNSAAGLTITLSTTGATAGDMLLIQSLPSSAVAQTITWVNTENSDVTPSANLNASTTSPRTDGFKWNPLTSKWRCIASC